MLLQRTKRRLATIMSVPESPPSVLTPAPTPRAAARGAPQRGPVILVHGLWMSGAVCAIQRAQLARRGYRTSVFSYPSIRLSLDEIASRLGHAVIALQAPRVQVV